MTSDEMIERLNRYDLRALDELKVMAQSDPQPCTQRIKELIVSSNLREDGGLSSELLMILADLVGQRALESWIREQWNSLNEITKRRILATLFKPSLLSTEFAIELFRAHGSTVGDRHRIAAGLASSAIDRGCEHLVVKLLSQIGEYEDVGRQNMLNAFKESVCASYGQYVPKRNC